MKIRFYAMASCASAVLVLCACSQPMAPSAAIKPAPHIDPATAVHVIRAAGDGIDSAVQVQPLRDPAIEGFLAKAHAAEAAHDLAAATEEARSALKLAPDAPDILQYLAELAIARADWLQADALATRSFALGPKIGSLCARNWQTVAEARRALDDDGTAAQAQQRLMECRVAPRLRM